jgi:mannose-6-phosphate isomerase-like protein (cupin superfamily)
MGDVAGRVIDPKENARMVGAAESASSPQGEERGQSVELYAGVHLSVRWITVPPGRELRLRARVSGREEVWYVVSGSGRYFPSREGLMAGAADEAGEGEPLRAGALAITRMGEGARAVCQGPDPLVLLCVTAPQPAAPATLESPSGV